MTVKQGAVLLPQLTQNIIQNSEVSMNLGGHIIVTTEDKVRLACMTHLAQMAEKKGWAAPAGVLFSIVAAFVTAEFKEALGVPAATWRAVFIVAGFLFFGWTIRAVVAAVRAPSVNEFVSVLKATSGQ